MTTLSMPKSSLSQNSSPKECLTTMVALETKDRMESLPCVELTMQTKRTYSSVIYMHLRHLPPPIMAKVYHYVRPRVYNGVIWIIGGIKTYLIGWFCLPWCYLCISQYTVRLGAE